MSGVPLSSPLSSSVKIVDIKYENACSSVSSLVVDYTLLKSIIESTRFEESLELYSLMLNHCLNEENQISLEISLKKFIKEYSSISLNELKELIEIFENIHFRSFLYSYDLIVNQFSSNLSDKDQENSLKESNLSNEIDMNKSSKLIDEEKVNVDYASKLSEYNVTKLKIIRLEKREGEPLGATISRLSDDDYRISIARILHGSIAQGLFTIGDIILEINNQQIQSLFNSLEQIVQFIDSLKGTISFLILPNYDQQIHGTNNQAFYDHKDDSSSEYFRALFSYDPYDDIYIPCRELALHFQKYSILKIVNRDDPSWWQAFIMENDEKSKKQQFPGLIPSKEFQEKRLKIVKSLLDDERNNSKKKLNKLNSQQRRKEKIVSKSSIYEPVEWYVPHEYRKRPIVLIGAPHIGRHEFRQCLMNSSELSSLIDVAVPHTTRLKKVDEICGRDYHFITREQFEFDISNDLFVEYGEYENNLYGTSKCSILTCCQILNKICILNLLPEGIDSLKSCNIFPYIIYFKAPSTIEKMREYFDINDQQWNEIKQKSDLIELNYSDLFDKIICLNDSFDLTLNQLIVLVKHIQTKSMWINQSYFSPTQRF